MSTDRTYRFVIKVFAALFGLLGIKFDVRGIDNLPPDGAAVLAGNHIGFLDFTFIGYAARMGDRRVRFLSKTSIFALPVVGRWRSHNTCHSYLSSCGAATASYPARPRDETDRWWMPSSKGGTAPDAATAARLDREALARIGDSIDG